MSSHSHASSPTPEPGQTGSHPASKEAREIVSFFKTLLILVVLAILLRECVIEAFKIPSGSMIPTLMKGDHILVSKLSYGLRAPFIKETLFQYGAPERGDVVVFTRPDDETTLDEDESKDNIIKRVMALPGEVVEVRGTTVFINDTPLHEPYAQWVHGGLPEGHFPATRVPDGHVFVLGDNRDESKDSRYWENDPFLPMNRIKGRALFIYFSWHDLARVGTVIR